MKRAYASTLARDESLGEMTVDDLERVGVALIVVHRAGGCLERQTAQPQQPVRDPGARRRLRQKVLVLRQHLRLRQLIARLETRIQRAFLRKA